MKFYKIKRRKERIYSYISEPSIGSFKKPKIPLFIFFNVSPVAQREGN